MNNVSRLDDVMTKDEINSLVQQSMEEVLGRSKVYIDERMNENYRYYDTNFQHLEEIMKANNTKYEVILKSIDDRLDRIDKRIEK
jgi:hypothetical protein